MTSTDTALAGRGVEWDLDAEAPPAPGPTGGHRRTVVVLLLLVLAGLGGAALRATTTDEPEARGGIGARLTVQEVTLQGRPLALLRVVVRNDTATGARITGLVVDGVASRTDILGHTALARQTVRLVRPLPAGGTDVFDVEVRPTCGRVTSSGPFAARLLLDDGRSAPVLMTPTLSRPGGLCREVNAELPGGWQSRISVRLEAATGPDLRVRLEGLTPGTMLAGVWAGDALVSRPPPAAISSSQLSVTLARPGGCPRDPATGRVPTGLRVIVTSPTGLAQRYAPIGPTLARWLVQDCTADSVPPIWR